MFRILEKSRQTLALLSDSCCFLLALFIAWEDLEFSKSVNLFAVYACFALLCLFFLFVWFCFR